MAAFLLLLVVSIGYVVLHSSMGRDALASISHRLAMYSGADIPAAPAGAVTAGRRGDQVEARAAPPGRPEMGSSDASGGAQHTVATQVDRILPDPVEAPTIMEGTPVEAGPAGEATDLVPGNQSLAEASGEEEDGAVPVDPAGTDDADLQPGEVAAGPSVKRTFQINFPSDSDEMVPDSDHVLGSVLVMLKENPDSLASITGFADNRGDSQYNLELSRRRAVAVQQYLIGAGIAPSRLSVEGRGSSGEPSALGGAETIDSMSRFRVVQIKVGGPPAREMDD